METVAPSLEGFACRRCGNCCRVPGYVRLQPGEAAAIAALLGLDTAVFTDRFTRLTRDRAALSLTENPDESCVFLDRDGACGIQAAKPGQCRDFPHAWRFSGFESICAAMQSAAVRTSAAGGGHHEA